MLNQSYDFYWNAKVVFFMHLVTIVSTLEFVLDGSKVRFVKFLVPGQIQR